MLREITILILTLFHEGSICQEDELRCIARVIQVRAEERKLPIKKVCLQKGQFSCWNGTGKAKILAAFHKGQIQRSPAWARCCRIVEDMYDQSPNGLLKQPNEMPRWNCYYNPDLVKPDSKAWEWINKMKDKKAVGLQVFGRIE